MTTTPEQIAPAAERGIDMTADLERFLQQLEQPAAAGNGSAVVEGAHTPVDQAGYDLSRPLDADLARELGGAFFLTFDFLGEALGDHWKMGRRQADTLGNAWSNVLLYYLPDLKSSPLYVAIVVTAIALGPKVMIDVRNRKKASKAKSAERGVEATPEVEQPRDTKKPELRVVKKPERGVPLS